MDDPLMHCSPGVTEPMLTAEPLGTEGEMTPGPDDINPYRSLDERRAVEETIQQQRQRARQKRPDGELLETVGAGSMGDPTTGDDPYVFDDVPAAVDDITLPFADATGPGPRW